MNIPSFREIEVSDLYADLIEHLGQMEVHLERDFSTNILSWYLHDQIHILCYHWTNNLNHSLKSIMHRLYIKISSSFNLILFWYHHDDIMIAEHYQFKRNLWLQMMQLLDDLIWWSDHLSFCIIYYEHLSIVM